MTVGTVGSPDQAESLAAKHPATGEVAGRVRELSPDAVTALVAARPRWADLRRARHHGPRD